MKIAQKFREVKFLVILVGKEADKPNKMIKMTNFNGRVKKGQKPQKCTFLAIFGLLKSKKGSGAGFYK